MINNQNDSLLLVIDIQEKLVNSVFNKEVLLKKSQIILESAKILDLPIFVTEQYPQGLGKTVFDLGSNINIYEKKDFNALSDETLLTNIKRTGKKQIVVFGIETHICVHQTVEALIEQGYSVTIITDACGSRAESEYKSALDSMKSIGASLKTTEMFLFELLKTSKHPNFKAIQSLIK